MEKEQLIEALTAFLRQHADVESVSRIDGEDAIGVEMPDGREFFIEIQSA